MARLSAFLGFLVRTYPPQPTNQPLTLNLAGIMLMNAGKSGENKERYATIQEQENGVALLV